MHARIAARDDRSRPEHAADRGSAVRWLDGVNDFGWISILLHWVAAAAVLTLLFVGSSIHASGAADADRALRLHTTLGLGLYALLWLRIVWRLKRKHPAALPRQNKYLYAVARPFHYVLILAIAVMLMTGPLMAWSGGLPLRLGTLAIPSPFGTHPELFQLTHRWHVTAASLLGWGTALHVLAVIVHAAIYRDGSFDRMLAPHAPGTERMVTKGEQ
jgi:cytochrome b561